MFPSFHIKVAISHATEKSKLQQQAPSHNNTFNGLKKVCIKYRSYIMPPIVVTLYCLLAFYRHSYDQE